MSHCTRSQIEAGFAESAFTLVLQSIKQAAKAVTKTAQTYLPNPAQAATGGAGELSNPPILTSPSASTSPTPPLTLLSLPTALLPPTASLFSLELSLFVSPFASSPGVLFGVFHELIFHVIPVKLLSWRPFFSHRRQGFPERSSARKPALMAPVFAFGPSLCGGIGAGPAVMGLPESAERSIEPSGL